VVFLRIPVVIMNCQNRPFTGERTMAASSRRNGKPSKLDCFIRFNHVSYWHSRARDLIANAETYSYPAFRESFRELRREARKSEMQLVIALFKFERAMNKAMAESKS
jgi:hypothetical protein